MQTYDVIRVLVPSGNSYELDDRVTEVHRYLYGRSFFLGRRPSEKTNPRTPTHELYFLVETSYVSSILPRLASGLMWGSVASAEEKDALGL
jgi:hypothetical protein